ncbi:MAG: hypothetical protein GY862_39330 [Gammaproteobacteria bacterium]|nr:hypothetical protein [Gammaproteobacteria bacterium]
MTATRYRQLTNDAESAYNQARFREAALLREQARHLAQQQRLPREAFSSGTWAAISWSMAGEPLRSLNLFSDLLREVPVEADAYDVWIARGNVFEVQRCWFPRLATLRQGLTELERLLREQPQLPPADVHIMHAVLLERRGHWAESLRHCESGWNLYNGSGFRKYLFAYSALIANLHQSKPEAAQDWCAALGETETHLPDSRAAWQDAQVQLALYRQQPQQAAQHAAELEELCVAMQINEANWEIGIPVRTRLLQTPPGDPQAADHPARRRFARRIPGKPEVFDVYKRRLLLLDYRLACLRWALGIAPVDDLWHTRPHDLSQPALCVSRREAQRRVFLARRAVSRAMVQAEYLDQCFETQRWTREIQAHAQRLEELARLLRQLRQAPNREPSRS